MAGERRARLAGIARTAIPASRKALQRRIAYLMIVVMCRREYSFGIKYEQVPRLVSDSIGFITPQNSDIFRAMRDGKSFLMQVCHQ